ncbi:hypothetical protein D3C87_1716730 [compost metagenome]
MVGNGGRRADLGPRRELFAQRLGEIRHGVEAAGTVVVDPALQLPRTERLLAELAAISGERVRVEVEQVDESVHDGKLSFGVSLVLAAALDNQRL